MAASRGGTTRITDNEKQVLVDRYLDIEWCDDVSEIKCVRCNRVAIHQYVSNCQHLFCRYCRTAFRDGGQWKCPRCRQHITRLDDQDWQLEDHIYQSKAHCPNQKYGCHYQGQLLTIPGHLRRCKNTRQAALDTMVDKVSILSASMEEIRSEVEDKCELVRRQTKAMVEGLTTNVNALVESLNEQKKQMAIVLKVAKEREARDAVEIDELRSKVDQLQTVIILKIAQLEQKMKQPNRVESQMKDIRSKVEPDPTINKYEVKSIGKQMMVAETKMPFEEIEAMTEVYDWDMRNITMKSGRIHITEDSQVFPLPGYQYGAKIKIVTVNFFDNYICLKLIDFNHLNRPIATNSWPKIAYVMKDLECSRNNRDIIRTAFCTFNQPLEFDKDTFNWPLGIRYTLPGPPYVVSNRIRLMVLFETPSIARTFFSNDGVLLWRLDHYKKRKEMEAEGLIEGQDSPYFYTRPQGYRVLVRLQLKYTSVSAELMFLTGEFDSYLTREFRHRWTVTIFNHTDESNNLVGSKENDAIFYSTLDFDTVNRLTLESNGYVKDDSLLIKVVVESL